MFIKAAAIHHGIVHATLLKSVGQQRNMVHILKQDGHLPEGHTILMQPGQPVREPDSFRLPGFHRGNIFCILLHKKLRLYIALPVILQRFIINIF